MVGAAAGRRNDDDSKWWRGCLFFSSSVQSPRSLFFSSLSVLPCFSSPSLVPRRFCRWWLGGTVEALVEVQRWFFFSSASLLLLPPSLPVLPFFFDGFPFSPLSSLLVSLLFLFLFSPLISSVSVCFSSLLSL